jgi:hypothetical protein
MTTLNIVMQNLVPNTTLFFMTFKNDVKNLYENVYFLFEVPSKFEK